MKDYIVDLTDGTRLPVNVNFGTLYYLQKLPKFYKLAKKETGKTDRSGKDGSCGRIRVRHPAEQRKKR